MYRTTPTASEPDHGDIPVDSGRILLVDPCHIPAEMLAALTAPNDRGVTLGVLAVTPSGDGLYPVLGDERRLIIVDPYGESRPAPWHAIISALE